MGEMRVNRRLKRFKMTHVSNITTHRVRGTWDGDARRKESAALRKMGGRVGKVAATKVGKYSLSQRQVSVLSI